VASDGRTGVIRRKNLDRPDEQRPFPHGTGVLVNLGAMTIGRAALEPGWRWSTDIKPGVGTASCQIHHFHLLLQGRFTVAMDSGETQEFEPNDVMDIPPGHDAWVSSDGSVVLVDIGGNVSDFGLPASRSRRVATILMTDIVASTQTAARIGDQAWKQRLAQHNQVTRHQFERYGGREIDTTGDGFLALFDAAGAALLAAIAIRDACRDIGLEVRIGVHTGEIETAGDNIRGLSVHAAARIMSEAHASQILTSAVTRALAEGVPCSFEDAGERQLKGLEQPIRLFAVEREG
jgi:class 3 adenylate cyclase